MQLTEAAAGVCDLLWLVDASLPEMHQMIELLDRFGPVVDISGSSVAQILKELSPPFRPDGLVTYLDANMATFARVAEELGLPFHSVPTAIALTDKLEQRRELHTAGLITPATNVIAPQQRVNDLEWLDLWPKWPAVLKPRSAQGSRYTFLVRDRERLDELLLTLGASRPEMVLEGYLDDDPPRVAE